MAHALLHPFAEPFMRRALVELLLLGLVGGLVGCWVVLYELAYSTESLAHALFPGLVVAALVGLPLVLGGATGVLIAAGAIALVAAAPSIGRDTGVAVVITTLFALGVVLALSPGSPPGIDGLLFGDLLGVTPADIAVSAALTAATLAAGLALYRPLIAVGFDRGSARAFGARPLPVELALLALVAVAVLVGVRALGNLLVVALIVGPAASARLLVRRLHAMMAAAVLIAWASGLAGLYLSYYVDVAAGAAVACCTVAAYLMALAASYLRGKTAASRSRLSGGQSVFES
jgi:ABC-type Mn2+/Zn2+ transport system permease subunit